MSCLRCFFCASLFPFLILFFSQSHPPSPALPLRPSLYVGCPFTTFLLPFFHSPSSLISLNLPAFSAVPSLAALPLHFHSLYHPLPSFLSISFLILPSLLFPPSSPSLSYRLGILLVSEEDNEVGVAISRGFYYIVEHHSAREALNWLLEVHT